MNTNFNKLNTQKMKFVKILKVIKKFGKQNFMEEGSALMMQRKKGTTTSQGMNRDEKIRISRPASEGLH